MAEGYILGSYRIAIGPHEVIDRMTMQGFVRGHGAMIVAPVQGDVDGIPKRSHGVSVPPIKGRVEVLS
jgi:hypothetical protein